MPLFGLSLPLSGFFLWIWHALNVKKEPAEISVGKYLHAPDYGGELGFIHDAEEDIRRLLDAIPGEKPIVIFVDDLDRCSSAKIAQVVEAVSMFLAGDLRRCMFVIGMDSGKCDGRPPWRLA